MSFSDFNSSNDYAKELCFDTNAFLKETFSIDEFLREHRHKTTLEALRDDLGTYLKYLRLSMIELINKDYEDFVNLSKDLVGLNKGIEVLQSPLQEIKTEVVIVRSSLEETITGLRNCLGHDLLLKEKKRNLLHLSHVMTSLEKLKALLSVEAVYSSSKRSTLDLIERSATEYNMVSFSIAKCSSLMSLSQKEDAQCIEKILMNLLNNTFLECLSEKQSEPLERCLRVYVCLHRVQDAEKLIREEIVAPFLHSVVCEVTLKNEGLPRIYQRILEFVDSQLGELIRLGWAYSCDFVVNSVWVELERRIELHMASVFAPGNPEVFHARFCETSAFLGGLQQRCGSPAVQSLFLLHLQTVHFRKKWNLLVYYKIRFQEIAGQLEYGLTETDTSLPSTEDSIYKLRASDIVFQCLQRCWHPQIFIPEISHLLWKLSLQILSRFSVWVKEESAKDQASSKPRADLANPVVSTPNPALRSRLHFLVCLHLDTSTLSKKAAAFLESVRAVPVLSTSALFEATSQVKDSLSLIAACIVRAIVQESVVHLSHVKDIPRLFRRTNRENPNKPCEYVSLLLQLPSEFYLANRGKVPEAILGGWIYAVFIDLSQQFYISVNDVLTNAQKTEESLRKLKKAKDKYAGTSESKVGSDDDKIRQQLVLDVASFGDGAKELGIAVNDIPQLVNLLDLVHSAKEKSEKQ